VWLDGPSKGRCLVLWRRLPDVAASIANWAASYGMSDSVMLLDELASGPEVAGTGAAAAAALAAGNRLQQEAWPVSSQLLALSAMTSQGAEYVHSCE
jgi:predicted butyrate kinase (DUF1464 family)